MKEIIIDNEKYFAYSEEEMSKMNEQQGKFDIRSDFPKIISFRILENNNLFILINDVYIRYAAPEMYYTLDKMLFGQFSVEDGYIEIYQVAVSENEIYTLGDNVKNVDNKFFTIAQFIVNDKYGIIAKDDKNSEYVEFLKRIEVPLLITEDGIKIYNKNEYVCGVCTKANWQTGEYLVWKLKRGRDNQHSSFNESSWKFFSTKEARDKYKDDNMPRFSKKEIKDAIIYAKRNYSKCTIIPGTEFREKLDI